MEHFFFQLETYIKYHQVVAFAASFVAGLISAVSPCALAAIPLAIGYVGGYSDGNKRKAIFFSLVYVLGLSLTFTLFGVAASIAGQILSFFGNWLIWGFASITVLMGLQLIGLFSLPLPFQKKRNVERRGLWGAFMLGVVTGTVSSPCATPVLAVILAYVATEGKVLYGGSLLFIYAIGHCALIFLAGLSVGIAESLIKSRGVQKMSIWAKQTSGVVLIATGIYIAYTTW